MQPRGIATSHEHAPRNFFLRLPNHVTCTIVTRTVPPAPYHPHRVTRTASPGHARRPAAAAQGGGARFSEAAGAQGQVGER